LDGERTSGVLLFKICTPSFKMRNETAVGDDVNAINFRDRFYLVEQVVEDGFAADFEQWFWEILRERIEPRGVAGGDDEGFHKSKNARAVVGMTNHHRRFLRVIGMACGVLLIHARGCGARVHRINERDAAAAKTGTAES